MDLNHLNLPVRDPAACRDFYQRHFGFQPAFEAEGGYFLRNERGFLLALLPAASDQPFRDGFQPAFEAEGGYFLRNERGFLLALLPAASDQPFRDGFHVGFGVDRAGDVLALWKRLSAAGVRTIHPEDFRPAEAYLTFRCWDPDGTEVEVFWQGP